ncbi:hypothetical protein Cgig2_009053 [Carnegiea gigantea]|uniref:Uncharacterized protein n=1 Tax=Carnegiea gigantea TaxID=171969 RepID=A0A9Q1KN42_9CARY|nr:hypothetical protein Cgig2_009053 [Carnegiea gigantea]
MDTLKSLMSTMADAITRQVSEQVKRAMEVAGSAQPVPEGEPSRRPEGRPSFRLMEHGREVARSDRSDRLPLGWQRGVQRRNLLPDLRRGKLQSGQLQQTPALPLPRDEECSTEVVAIIAGGYVEKITRTAWKAQLRSAQQSKFKSLEVDFLVVDVPTTYNVIIARPTLHRVKANDEKKGTLFH